MPLANAAYLGIERHTNNRVNENWMSASSDDKASEIPAGYQQVLGNQYLIASERLEDPESLLKRGNLSVRKLVRQVAKSGLYRMRFFESSNPCRFIELNFEHLLGHAPQNTAEMLHHFTILQEQGSDAEIDSDFDSAEYQDRFGEEGVAYLHGWHHSVGQQDVLLTVKKNQRRQYRQIASQFRGHRRFPFEISDFDASNGRQVRWPLRARNATGAIRERWAGASWIIELVSTGRRDGKPFHNIHIFITTLRTSPKALLRLVRQRWAIEN